MSEEVAMQAGDNVRVGPEQARRYGQWLRQEMGKRGWSQNEVFRRTGLLPTYISRILNGRAVQPTVLQVARLANTFGATPSEIFEAAGWWSDPLSGLNEGSFEEREAAKIMKVLGPKYREPGLRALLAVYDASPVERDDSIGSTIDRDSLETSNPAPDTGETVYPPDSYEIQAVHTHCEPPLSPVGDRPRRGRKR
jgi:transcriptional regulator with XRE-family HTH domain